MHKSLEYKANKRNDNHITKNGIFRLLQAKRKGRQIIALAYWHVCHFQPWLKKNNAKLSKGKMYAFFFAR